MEVYIKIHKVRIKIATNYEPYSRYLKLHFNKVILPKGSKDFDISICADWITQALELTSSGGVDKIAANTLMGEGKIVTIHKIKKRKKVKMDFELKGKKLLLRAESRFKTFKDTLRYKIFNQPRESYFFELTYALVYYPLFWYAEYFLNAHPLHASSVKLKDKAVVLYGMEGVGKTTFSLMLSNRMNGNFLCDNIIFFDKEKIYPCYEPLRLHRDENTYLWEKNFKRINKFRTIKDFYEPVFDVETEGVVPSVIIFLRFSKDFSVRELPAGKCTHKIINSNVLAQELGSYEWYEALMNLLVDDYDSQSRYRESLKGFLSKTACYEISMVKSEGINATFEKIKESVLEKIR